MVVLAAMAYGASLAGFVPLGAIMAMLAPESRGAAISIYNLGFGLSIWLGPALAGVFLPRVGVAGLMWIFAVMYLTSDIRGAFEGVTNPMSKERSDVQVMMRITSEVCINKKTDACSLDPDECHVGVMGSGDTLAPKLR